MPAVWQQVVLCAYCGGWLFHVLVALSSVHALVLSVEPTSTDR